MPPSRSSLVPLWLAVTGGLLAVSILISGQAARAGAPMLWFLAGVSGIAGAAQLAIAALAGPLRIDGRVLAYAAAAGLLQALPNAIGYLAVGHVGAGFLSLTFAFPILLTWAMARAVGLEPRSPRRAFAVALGLAGGLLLAAGKMRGLPDGAAVWAVAACAAPVLIAAGNIYRSRYWPAGPSPVVLAGLTLVSAALCILPVAALTEPLTPLRAPAPLALMLAGAAAFTVQFVTFFQLQRAGGPVMLSLIGPVAAVGGAGAAALFLGESLPATLLPAAALTGAGVALMLCAPRRPSA